MIEDIGKVVKLTGETAHVQVERSSACAQCGLQETEELLGGGKVVFQAFNEAKAKVGDRVLVRVQQAAYVKATGIVFGIPVLLMIAGAVGGWYLAGLFHAAPEGMAALLSMAGLIAGGFLLLLFRKRLSRPEYMPVVVEIRNEEESPGV
jgi:sigma-E factor negative regulatory protein RseC